MLMLNDRRFSVNGQPHGEKKDISLPDRQRKANETVAGIMDQINERVAELEKLLKTLQPTQDAFVPYPAESWDNEWESCADIGFVKYEDHRHPSAWRICHRSYEANLVSNERRNETGWKPLTDCPRWLRVHVVSDFPKLLPQLLEEIVNATEDFVPTARKAKAALEQALASLKEALGQV
jgi:hypothetical protein